MHGRVPVVVLLAAAGTAATAALAQWLAAGVLAALGLCAIGCAQWARRHPSG
jgi:hypothetical protein